MRVCDFPNRIFFLVGGASFWFYVSRFEGDGDGDGVGGDGGGSVFLNDIVVLLLELEGHSVTK